MRIVTGFKDYYDGVCRSDGDHRTTLVRKSVTHRVASPAHGSNLAQLFRDYRMAIFFADKWYPGYAIPGDYDVRTGIKSPTRYIYDADTACQGITSKWAVDSIQSFFRSFDNPNEALTEIADKYGPICLLRCLKVGDGEYIEDASVAYRTFVVEQNPKLEPLGFASVLPPQMAYMALYKYLCNKGGDKPIPEMSNDTKIELAGFDLKTSFRKPKSGKRNRK